MIRRWLGLVALLALVAFISWTPPAHASPVPRHNVVTVTYSLLNAPAVPEAAPLLALNPIFAPASYAVVAARQYPLVTPMRSYRASARTRQHIASNAFTTRIRVTPHRQSAELRDS